MKYYRDILVFISCTFLAAVLWLHISNPKSFHDIYQGIGFEATQNSYLFHIAEFLGYVWTCMGFVTKYLKQGGMYRLLRKRNRGNLVGSILVQLIKRIIILEVIRILIYSIVMIIFQHAIFNFSSSLFIKQIAIHCLVFYQLSFVQILAEILYSEKIGFAFIWAYDLIGLYIGDFLSRGGYAYQLVMLFPQNYAMQLRLNMIATTMMDVILINMFYIFILITIIYIYLKYCDLCRSTD